jgi:hypothetical protein
VPECCANHQTNDFNSNNNSVIPNLDEVAVRNLLSRSQESYPLSRIRALADDLFL